MISRLYQNIPLSVNQQVTLDEKASHHLMTVLKRKVNDPVIIFNGQGGEYHGHITTISKRQVSVLLAHFQDNNVESKLHIHLGQAISRGDKMDLTLQKAVELGVTDITPLISERCGVRLSQQRFEKKMQHWQNIVISACEQCGRNTLPTLANPVAIDEWLINREEQTRLLLAPEIGQSLSTIEHPQGNIVLLVGPEGGLSDREIQSAAHHHFTPLTLGPRILRTETAALVALSVIQATWGDLC